MKYVSYQDYIEHDGGIYKVQAKPSGIHTKPLKAFLDELDWMLSRHSRVFVFRFDLRFSDDNQATEDSTLMRILFRRLRAQVERYYKTKDIGYSWAREKEKAKQQHYHCVLMMDGNRIRHPKELCVKIARIWFEISGGRAHWSRWHFFHRQDYVKRHKAIYHCSYLFKARGKGYKPRKAKDYGHSKLKLKMCKVKGISYEKS